MFPRRVDSNGRICHVTVALSFIHEYTSITYTLFIMCLSLFFLGNPDGHGHGHGHGHGGYRPCSEFTF